MNKLFMSCLAGVALSATAQKATITVAVGNPGHEVSPTLFGIFLAAINLSVDGGLLAVQGREGRGEGDEG